MKACHNRCTQRGVLRSVVFQAAEEGDAAEDEDLAGGGGDGVGHARCAVEEGEFADLVAGAAFGDVDEFSGGRYGADVHVAAEDDVEAARVVAFVEEGLFGGVKAAASAVGGEASECGVVEDGEDGDAAQGINVGVGDCERS